MISNSVHVIDPPADAEVRITHGDAFVVVLDGGNRLCLVGKPDDLFATLETWAARIREVAAEQVAS